MQNKKPKSINVSPEVHTDLLSLKVDLCRNGKSEMCNSMDSLIKYLIDKEVYNPILRDLQRLDLMLTDNPTYSRSAEEILNDLRKFIKEAENKRLIMPTDIAGFCKKDEKKTYKDSLLYCAGIKKWG